MYVWDLVCSMNSCLCSFLQAAMANLHEYALWTSIIIPTRCRPKDARRCDTGQAKCQESNRQPKQNEKNQREEALADQLFDSTSSPCTIATCRSRMQGRSHRSHCLWQHRGSEACLWQHRGSEASSTRRFPLSVSCLTMHTCWRHVSAAAALCCCLLLLPQLFGSHHGHVTCAASWAPPMSHVSLSCSLPWTANLALQVVVLVHWRSILPYQEPVFAASASRPCLPCSCLAPPSDLLRNVHEPLARHTAKISLPSGTLLWRRLESLRSFYERMLSMRIMRVKTVVVDCQRGPQQLWTWEKCNCLQ